MATHVELSIAGPIPDTLGDLVATVRIDIDADRLEHAETLICDQLEQDCSSPHLFLLLNEVASRRDNLIAAGDYARNAALLDQDNAGLFSQALIALLETNRNEDAAGLARLYERRDFYAKALTEVRERVGQSDVLQQLAPPDGVDEAVAEVTHTAASFDTADAGQPVDRALFESGSIEANTLDMAALSDTELANILPAASPFTDTPAHQLAQKTACPGLDRYLLAMPPTWNVPRIEDLLRGATAAINRTLDFFEAMHFRGMWPQAFSVAGLESPEHGHDNRPRDFRWELGDPGFARVMLAHLVAGYEATKHVAGLKHVIRSAKALAVHQHRLGGWATSYRVRKAAGRGWPASFPANAVWMGGDSTTTTLCLLIYVTQQVDVPMVATAAQRTVQAIMHAQNADGSWPMVWVEQERARAELDRQYGAGCLLMHVMDNAMRGLALARYAMQRHDVVPSMVSATEWLLARQAEGEAPGWLASYDEAGQPGPHGSDISIAATTGAIEALCFGAAVSDSQQCIDACRNALRLLEKFERMSTAIGDFVDAKTGEPVPGTEPVWTPARMQRVLQHLRRRVREDCMGEQKIPDKMLRTRMLHDAQEMCSLVAAALQNQHPCGLWADSNNRAVPAGAYTWTLATFLQQHSAGRGKTPLELGRRTHWQDYLMPDRQWLKVGT